jgi:hypothetical protein
VNIQAFTVSGAGAGPVSTASVGATTNQDLASCPVGTFLVGGGATITTGGLATNGDAAIVSSFPFPAANLGGTASTPSQSQSWVAQAVVTRAQASGTITVTAQALCRA